MVLLILFFLRSLLLIGNFFGQYLQIRKVDRLFMTKVEALTPATVGELRASLPANTKSPLLNCLAGMLDTTKDRAHRQLLLSDYEIAADKDLGTSKTLSKMGPMLGLMGTLIPMGPALVGLSTGDIGSMAYNMQVAFATTVVGLFSASSCRRCWTDAPVCRKWKPGQGRKCDEEEKTVRRGRGERPDERGGQPI